MHATWASHASPGAGQSFGGESRELERSRAQLRLLTEVSDAIASQADLTGLFHDLARRLPAVVPFEMIALFVHDADKNVLRVHMLGTADTDVLPPGLEMPVDESFSGQVFKSQERVVVEHRGDTARFPRSQVLAEQIGVESFCMLPLTTVGRRLGAIAFGSAKPSMFGESKLEFLELVARQVAVAVDNVLHRETAHTAQEELARERDRLRLLLEVNNAVVSHLNMDHMFRAIGASLARVIQQDGCSLVLLDPESGKYRCYVLLPGSESVTEGSAEEPMTCPAGAVIMTREPKVLGDAQLRALATESEMARRLVEKGVRSFAGVPLVSHDRVLGSLNVGRLSDTAFTQADVDLLSQAAQQIAIAVENSLAYQQIDDLKEKLGKEKLYLEEEIRTTYNFDEIVGQSEALRRVLAQATVVAPTDSTVLIQGETGTGKELIARAIHSLSGRKSRTFVKLNCAAIPTGLLESELFGHEKGAFTGAIAQKVGRFQLADGGTLFLDEVGEIPLELQSKFLRVLQEQEFERLGGTKTIKVNVRLVAATNRDLAAMVGDREFRSDLFYRLNVFPIVSPPLRERREDIPTLVRHFSGKFARRMNKRVTAISTRTMDALSEYHWPGNIRELENFIERAVILSRGSDLEAPLGELKGSADAAPSGNGNGHANGRARPETLEDAEREHIRRALEQANWAIGGPGGAATKLGMKRTTLQSRMAKLGIVRPTARS